MKSYQHLFLFILIFACFLFFPVTGFSQNVSPNPTRPSASDNAYLSQFGYTELEFGLSTQENFWTLPALLKFTVHKNLELGFLMSGLFNHSGSNNEPGDPGIQLKAQLMKQNWGAFSFVGRVEHIGNKKPKYTFYSVGSFPFNKFSVDGTFGVSFFDRGNGGHANSIQYAVSLNSNSESSIGAFLEIYGENSAYSNPSFIDGGLSYGISQKAVLDCSVAFGLNDDAADWIVQVGFTTVLFRLLK